MTKTQFPIEADVLHRAANVIRCLGHPMRLRLLELLEHGEKSVSELIEGTCASQSAVSQQLSILRGHGVVDARREGAFVLYRITEPKVRHILGCIRSCDLQDERGPRSRSA
jgi:ArsR family transcriptional regulator